MFCPRATLSARWFALLLVLIVGISSARPAAAQEHRSGDPLVGSAFADDEPTIQVLPLGSFHFAGAPDFNDPAAPVQQAEIRAVVDSLVPFRPTKVAIERQVEDSAYVDSLYRDYRAGRGSLRVNEAYQIGSRVAKRRGHERVYSIDYKRRWPMDSVMTWAQQHKPSFVHYAKRWREQLNTITDSLHRTATVREILLHLNSDRFLDRIQAMRMRTLEVGAGSTYIGVEPPASVARRNMRIFANLLAAAEPGDRILIVYGTGHSHYFREYIRDHPEMELVYPKEYL
jgi:hypothetical protein